MLQHRRLPAPQRYLLNRPFRRRSERLRNPRGDLVRMQRRSIPGQSDREQLAQHPRISQVHLASGIGTSPPDRFRAKYRPLPEPSNGLQVDQTSDFSLAFARSVQKQATSVQIPNPYTRINMGTWSIGHPLMDLAETRGLGVRRNIFQYANCSKEIANGSPHFTSPASLCTGDPRTA